MVLKYHPDSTSIYKVQSASPYRPHTAQMVTLDEAWRKAHQSMVNFSCVVYKMAPLTGTKENLRIDFAIALTNIMIFVITTLDTDKIDIMLHIFMNKD